MCVQLKKKKERRKNAFSVFSFSSSQLYSKQERKIKSESQKINKISRIDRTEMLIVVVLHRCDSRTVRDTD